MEIQYKHCQISTTFFIKLYINSTLHSKHKDSKESNTPKQKIMWEFSKRKGNWQEKVANKTAVSCGFIAIQ